MPSIEQVKNVKDENQERILSKPNVVGVGVGYKVSEGVRTNELSVVAMVRKKVPPDELPPGGLVPEAVDSIPTDVIQVGEIRAQQARTDRWRPAPGGVSIGHYQITAGTLGTVVRDRATGERLILSNNHVLANSNDAKIGDPILQPGPYDGGTQPDDVIAHLLRFCPITFLGDQPGNCPLASLYVGVGNVLAILAGSSHRVEAIRTIAQAANQVDCAIARPVDDSAISNDILEIGAVTGKTTATLGMAVRKSGRTTGLTTGEITLLDATVNVSYGTGKTAQFDHQLVSGPMSQGGDSGSLLVAGDSLLAVGLLFAGSDQTTIFNPIQAVLDCLEVDILSEGANQSEDPNPSTEKVQSVKNKYSQELLSKPNVVGVGVGYKQTGGVPTNKVALVVMVDHKVPASELTPEQMIPSELEGVPVDVQQTGEIKAL